MPRRSSCTGTERTSTPPTSMRPPVGSSSRLIIRSVVVLPQPDGPTRATSSPSGTSRERSPTAGAGRTGEPLLDVVEADGNRCAHACGRRYSRLGATRCRVQCGVTERRRRAPLEVEVDHEPGRTRRVGSGRGRLTSVGELTAVLERVVAAGATDVRSTSPPSLHGLDRPGGADHRPTQLEGGAGRRRRGVGDGPSHLRGRRIGRVLRHRQLDRSSLDRPSPVPSSPLSAGSRRAASARAARQRGEAVGDSSRG